MTFVQTLIQFWGTAKRHIGKQVERKVTPHAGREPIADLFFPIFNLAVFRIENKSENSSMLCRKGALPSEFVIHVAFLSVKQNRDRLNLTKGSDSSPQEPASPFIVFNAVYSCIISFLYYKETLTTESCLLNETLVMFMQRYSKKLWSTLDWQTFLGVITSTSKLALYPLRRRTVKTGRER